MLAQGDLVAIIEEHCVAPPDWLATIRRSFRPDDAAIGGPILDHDFRRLRDWSFISPSTTTYPSAPWQPYPGGGANIAYRRDLLLEYQTYLARVWEIRLTSEVG